MANTYYTFADYLPTVRRDLGGRTDIDDRIRTWMTESYREIAMNYDLETLQTNVAITFSPNVDPAFDYPADARAIKALTLVNQSTSSPVELKKRNMAVIRKYPSTPGGTPAIWAPENNSIFVRPVPLINYDGTIDYWRKPTIDQTSSTTLDTTQVELPDDWIEIFTKAAVMRGHMGLTEFDKAVQVRTLLHGDPNPQVGWPGLIAERNTRDSSEKAVSDFGMRPRLRRYGSK